MEVTRLFLKKPTFRGFKIKRAECSICGEEMHPNNVFGHHTSDYICSNGHKTAGQMRLSDEPINKEIAKAIITEIEY